MEERFTDARVGNDVEERRLTELHFQRGDQGLVKQRFSRGVLEAPDQDRVAVGQGPGMRSHPGVSRDAGEQHCAGARH